MNSATKNFRQAFNGVALFFAASLMPLNAFSTDEGRTMQDSFQDTEVNPLDSVKGYVDIDMAESLTLQQMLSDAAILQNGVFSQNLFDICTNIVGDTIIPEEGSPEYKDFLINTQKDLMAIGFNLGYAKADGDKGRKTNQSIEFFKLLYLDAYDCAGKAAENGKAVDDSLDQYTVFALKAYADIARDDAKKYKTKMYGRVRSMKTGIASALRLASVKSKVDFELLAEMAKIESKLGRLVSAPTSTAVGVFQFIEETWLRSVKKHGDKYGLEDFAKHIYFRANKRGQTVPRVKNPIMLRQILDLRRSPHLSALMAAEHIKENAQDLKAGLPNRPINYTDIYMAHFLGVRDAVKFLKYVDTKPRWTASKKFKRSANANKGIFFHWRTEKAFSFQKIYSDFEGQFKTGDFYNKEYEKDIARRINEIQKDNLSSCLEVAKSYCPTEPEAVAEVKSIPKLKPKV